MRNIEERIFEPLNNQLFDELAIEIFQLQAKNTKVYSEYINLIGRKPKEVKTIDQIPFLPIQFFKTRNVILGDHAATLTFTSSGTSAAEASRHLVAKPEIYQASFINGFRRFYGDPSDYCILALLPSYLERGGSSLVYMVNGLIGLSKNSGSGFFLKNYKGLENRLNTLMEQNQKTLLMGVSYALLDFASRKNYSLKNVIVMETGGMKGRRKELVRKELHQMLTSSLGVETIHSEYGMTELLSQAYSKGDGIFQCPPWMRVLIRDPYDPFVALEANHAGAINVIDLANLYSCSFVQTDDMGLTHSNGSFEVLGRFDHAQIRGCNLLA